MVASSNKVTFLPAAMRIRIRAFALQACGFGLIILPLFLAASFASYNGSDPSVNTATASTTQNAMGAVGAGGGIKIHDHGAQ